MYVRTHSVKVNVYVRIGDIVAGADSYVVTPTDKRYRMSALFSEGQLGALKLANRIAVSPMCQYMAKEGAANSWHTVHLGSLALSGAAVL